MRYLEQRHPERFLTQITSGLRARKFKKKKNASLWDTLLRQILTVVKNPYLHLLIFRFCLFGWIFLYFAFQSLVPLFLLCHSVVYQNRERFMNILKYFYLPLLWLIFFFNYIVNIQGLFNVSIYTADNWRFGIFQYEPAFIHLLYQTFTLFYACFTLYLFREYDEEAAREAERKQKKQMREQYRRERLSSQMSQSIKESASSVKADESFLGESRLDHSHTYEIVLRFLLKHIDITLMVVLYIAGVNRIDVYHMVLLTLFAIYIMYPEQFRKRFIILLYFMIFIATIKYFYVLFLPEFQSRKTLNDVFLVLGFATDIVPGRKYGHSNLFNNNYLVVFTGFIQYRLYTSEYSKTAFTEKQAAKDMEMFGTKYPNLTAWLTVIVELVQLAIPWITYIIFLIIAVVNNKSLINWVLLTMTLILLFWHISADLVTTKSHVRLTRGWATFTLVSAICFLVIVIFQILCLDPISHSQFARDFVDSLPTFITKNIQIIGLEDFTDFTVKQLAVKFLAYVAYFNLSVITRRQFVKSSKKVADYEKSENQVKNLSDLPSNPEGNQEQVLEAKFSLVFVIYKLRKLWPVFDIISWHTFTILSIVTMVLSFHWKISIASLIYICILLFYYVLLPFMLQPAIKNSEIKENSSVSAQDLAVLWNMESIAAKHKIVWLKNKVIVFISFFTVCCI